MAEITIQSVANGFVVRVPQDHSFPGPMREVEMFRTQARIMRDEFQRDDMLQEVIQPEKKTMDEVMESQKDQTLFTFKTFPDVLAFLAKEMKI